MNFIHLPPRLAFRRRDVFAGDAAPFSAAFDPGVKELLHQLLTIAGMTTGHPRHLDARVLAAVNRVCPELLPLHLRDQRQQQQADAPPRARWRRRQRRPPAAEAEPQQPAPRTPPQQPAPRTPGWVWDALDNYTFYALRKAHSQLLATNAEQHTLSVNTRLVDNVARVLRGELDFAGAAGIAAPAVQHAARRAVSALLRESDLVWRDEAWLPGGGIVPGFSRALTDAETAAFDGWRLYVGQLRLLLERPDPFAAAPAPAPAKVDRPRRGAFED